MSELSLQMNVQTALDLFFKEYTSGHSLLLEYMASAILKLVMRFRIYLIDGDGVQSYLTIL